MIFTKRSGISEFGRRNPSRSKNLNTEGRGHGSTDRTHLSGMATVTTFMAVQTWVLGFWTRKVLPAHFDGLHPGTVGLTTHREQHSYPVSSLRKGILLFGFLLTRPGGGRRTENSQVKYFCPLYGSRHDPDTQDLVGTSKTMSVST